MSPSYNNQIKIALSLKDAILDAYHPEIVILFGSTGRGDADEFSDVDLLVIIDTIRDPVELGEEISAFTDYITTDKHIIVRSFNDYLQQYDIPGTIVYSAVNEGRKLFENKGLWKRRPPNIDVYEKRRQEIIQREYIQQAYDFLDQAESALKSGYLFRFRDFARFSAVRAIKGIFVWNDIHPPRETDLHYLMESAKKMEPKLEGYSTFLEDLNNYCPGRNTPSENQRNTAILLGMVDFLKDINTWINALLTKMI